MWPYATLAPGAEQDGGESRVCAVQSEEAWWNDWKDAIRDAALAKRQGWVTTKDLMERAMAPRKEEPDRREEWGRDWY